MLRYEPEEKCPPTLALASALQIFVPNTISVILLTTIVVLASGQGNDYLAWAVFSGLVITGLSTILHSFRFWQIGSGRLVVTNFNVPFLAVTTLALATGGPGLLASLVMVSTVLQFLITVRLASFRRLFTPTVSGTVIMLVAVSAVPFIVSRTIIAPQGVSLERFLIPGIAALAVGALVTLKGSPGLRLWTLPLTLVSGVAVAAPMGLYDIGLVIEAQWVSLPDLTWRGFDFTFGVEFWSLLPGFVFVSLTAYLKSLGDLSAIYQASYRERRALDHRVVQSGLNLYGGTTFLTGVLGTVPISAPWAVTVVYVSFTGVASKVVGIYLGLATLAIAPFSKLIAFLVVVPSPVLSAIYVIIFGALFVEGAKIAFAGQMDHKRGTVIGVSLVVGISAGSLAGQLEGSLGNIAGSVVASGSAVALAMTAVTGLTRVRRRKLEVDLALSSLTPIAEFLDGFATNRGWSEEARNRLHHVGEEVTLSLLEQDEENGLSEGEDRRLTATTQAEGDSVEVEFVVFSHDTTGQNIEDRLAYMESDSGLEDGQQFSMRLLSHYASSVHHRKYYGIDIVTVRVDR
ncbi:MAG: hypothetical protein F4X94_09485 [Dehalococcoidia bacterium]|nr:hypothetical protein [Dehalococcoidia bacterium]